MAVFEPGSSGDGSDRNADYLLIGFFHYGLTPASFSFIFGLLKQTLQFLQQIYVKNVHPVYSAGNQTRDLWNVSLFL